MNLEITGKLVEKYDTQNVSDRFKKREFVLELVEEVNGNPYTNYAKMQLVQNKCDILDRFNVGDTLRVNFNIKGNRYEKEGRTSYFSNLDAWRLEKADAANMNNGNAQGGYQNNGGYNNQGGGNWNNNQGGNNGGGWNNNQGGNAQGGYQNNGGNQYQQQPQGAPASNTTDDLPF